jgi:pimeloyl-ACP methyl ester carboxylesterase
VTKLAVTRANARFDGYTAENQEWARSFDSAGQPVSHDYARLSPDGLARRSRTPETDVGAEPNFTNEELESIEAPTLLIVGDRDIVTPEHAVEMFRTIPGAQLCVVPNAGHGAMPEETVLTFLREEATSAK